MFSLFRNYLKNRQVYHSLVRSGLFDSEYYLYNNLEVARDCVDPVKHYLRCGWRQGRNPNPYFDTNWYLKMHPDVEESHVNPLFHYISNGWKSGSDPSPRFSVKRYLERHPDLANSGSEPLCHFLQEQKAGPEVVDFSKLQDGMNGTQDFGKVAIHAHIYYTDLIAEFVEYINHMPQPFDCFFTTDSVDKEKIIREIIGDELNAQKVEIRVTPNVGRDIAPFVVGCRDLLNDYDYVCHIHTKKALHTTHNDYGNTWRQNLLNHLLGSQGKIRAMLKYFSDHPDVGLLYPKNFIPIEYCWEVDVNKWNMEHLIQRIGLKVELPWKIVCPVGSMFWVRAEAFRNLYDADMSYSEFEDEVAQLDGALAHAFERLFVYIALDSGFSSRIIDSEINADSC